jgi:predicted Zn-dependent protease
MGQFETLKDYEWEYILIEEPETLNAWCMPGGKIAFYTGILDITENEDGMASVMGHEIAHAVAKHSLERASQSLALKVGTTILDIALEGALSSSSADDYLVNLGLTLPFNRLQESEADYLGLSFMTMAKYDNNEAYRVWERMQKAQEGKTPPEFLSTHPSPKNRIEKIKNWIPEVNLRFS